MKYAHSIIFRALCAVATGSLLLVFPTEGESELGGLNLLVIILGSLFLIPGLVSLVNYFRFRTQEAQLVFPIIGLGSVLFGLTLVLFPDTFRQYLAYILAAFIILAGISMLVSMLRYRAYARVHGFFLTMPIVFAAAGIAGVVLIRSNETLAEMVMGITMLVYGLTEMASAITFRKVRREMAQAKQTPEQTPCIDVEAVEVDEPKLEA